MKSRIVLMQYITFFILILLSLPAGLFAQSGVTEAVEVTAPGNRQLKLAVETPRNLAPAGGGAAAGEMGDVIAFDMNMSGAVTAETRPQALVASTSLADTPFISWMTAGFDLVVRAGYSLAGDNLTVEFRLFDVVSHKMMTARRYLGTAKDLRRFAHDFSDEILLVVT